MPFGEVSVDKGMQRVRGVEKLVTATIHLGGSVLEGFFNQLVFGGEVRIKAAMSQTQCFHKRL